MTPLLFFWLFLKASLLSTGGLGNLPFLQKDLMERGWAKSADFATAIAVGQTSPGPTGLWSISLGYLTFGWLGAILALVALSLPPLLVLVISASFDRLEKNPSVQIFSRGLGIGVVGLTLAVAAKLAGSLIHTWTGVGMAATAMLLALDGRIPVILILVLAAGVGAIQ